MYHTTPWQFRAGRFTISLQISESEGYIYDGDDEDGETQAALDSGEYIAFDSRVVVEVDGVEIGSDSLGGSVYSIDTVSDFWTAHRDPNPMNRNCSLMRAARGQNVCICHYFPGMVSEAVAEARRFIATLTDLRHPALASMEG